MGFAREGVLYARFAFFYLAASLSYVLSCQILSIYCSLNIFPFFPLNPLFCETVILFESISPVLNLSKLTFRTI